MSSHVLKDPLTFTIKRSGRSTAVTQPVPAGELRRASQQDSGLNCSSSRFAAFVMAVSTANTQ